MQVTDRVCVVTGGRSGIGKALCQRFAADGARAVVVVDRDGDGASAVATEIGGRAEVVDVGVEAEVTEMLTRVEDELGPIDVLCNNAGIGIPTATHKMKLDDWKWIIDVDLWGPIYGVNVFLPIIEEQGQWGHVNATSSMAGLMAGQMMGAYNVAKHGVVGLMATLERDLRGRNSPVTASVLCPGPINTNISRNSVEYRPGQSKPKADGETAGKTASRIQAFLEKGMDPDDVGKLVLESIGSDEFWILTHPRWTKAMQNQLDAMNESRALTDGR